MEFRIWHKSYVPEVFSRFKAIGDNNNSRNLIEMIDKITDQFPDYPALSFFGKKISYRQFSRKAEKLAGALRRLGIEKRDRLALVLPNCPQAVIGYYAGLKAGAIIVPCNPLYTARELEHQLRDAGAKAAIVLDLFYPKIKIVKETINDKNILQIIIAAGIADYLPFYLSLFYPAVYPFKLRKKIKAAQSAKNRKEAAIFAEELVQFNLARTELKNDRGKFYFFKKLVKSGNSFPRGAVQISKDDLAVLQYTGGTTGTAKGAMLTHGNLLNNVNQLAAWFVNAGAGKEKFLAALPLFHIFGMTVAQNTCFSLGGEIILVPKATDLDEVIKAIVKEKPTIVPGVPRLFNAILGKYENQDFSSIKYSISGGAGLPRAVVEEFERVTGGKLVEGYGLTEASPVTHANPLGGLCKIGSIGVPLPETDAEIIDEIGKKVPAGEIGELLVSGPQVMKGYWNKLLETAKVLTGGGWLKTGDLAVRDEDGYFYIKDRKKNVIISDSGYNVYPNEVEDILRSHPAVSEAAVIGLPIKEGTEKIKAFVVLKEGEKISEKELIGHCRKSLVYYKIPKEIEFREVLPKTIIGKTLHRLLREEEMAKSKEVDK
ncbi:MAG: long-chain fatty acid--CoA ligase [Patescibacteria group bacterium]